MGADAFVCTGENEFADVQACRRRWSAPDVVFECIGVPGALQQSINQMRTSGPIVPLGFCTKPDGVVASISTFKQATLVFSMAYSIDEFRFALDAFDRAHGEPRTMVSKTISLADVPAMIERMRNRESTEVKVHAQPDL